MGIFEQLEVLGINVIDGKHRLLAQLELGHTVCVKDAAGVEHRISATNGIVQVEADANDDSSTKVAEGAKRSKPQIWAIAITFADEENNGFVSLGGAGWADEAEWEAQWENMPVSPLGDEDPANLIADKLDHDGDLIDEKRITAETAEHYFGRPLAELIAEGRANTTFTLGQMKAQNPEFAAKFRKRTDEKSA